MDAAEVVVGEVQAEGGPQVLPLLAEGIRQAGKPANLHPHREVLALHNRSADTLGIGAAHDWDHLRAGDLRRAVPRFALNGRAVNLDELGEVAAVVKCGRDRRAVGTEAIGRDLERSRSRGAPQPSTKRPWSADCGGRA